MSTPLEQAIAATRSVVANVRPDQLDDPTPCESWKVRDLINHTIGSQVFFVGALGGTAPEGGPDYASGDFVQAYDAATSAAVEAFAHEGVADRTFTLPFGELPGSAVGALLATDTFTHGWDLAKATGQPTDLDPDLAAALLDGARGAIQDGARGPDGKAPFGAPQEAPDGCTSADELAAFLGRVV